MPTCEIIITWILVILGWVVVHFLTQKRDINKDLRLLCFKATTIIEDLERDAIAYHTAAERNFDLEKKIRKDLQFLDTICSILQNKAECRNIEVIRYRQSITAENFATHLFSPKTLMSRITFSISCEAEDLIAKLLTAAHT